MDSLLPPIGTMVVTRFADGSDPSPQRSFLLYRIPNPEQKYATFYQMQVRRPVQGVLIGTRIVDEPFDSDRRVMPCIMVPELGAVWVKERSHTVVAVNIVDDRGRIDS